MTNLNSARLGVLALVAIAVSACERLTETEQRQQLSAELRGDSVKPTLVSSTGTGSLSATLAYLNGEASLQYSLSFSGLTGTATAVHLHGPASADNVGELLVDLASLPAGSTGAVTLGGVAGTASGTLDLATPMSSTVSGDSLHVLLDAGQVYVDVHTSAHVGGEIRGQIRKR
jgi:hypothetical protein